MNYEYFAQKIAEKVYKLQEKIHPYKFNLQPFLPSEEFLSWIKEFIFLKKASKKLGVFKFYLPSNILSYFEKGFYEDIKKVGELYKYKSHF